MYYLPQYNIYVVTDDENSGLKLSKTDKNFIVFYGKNHKSSELTNEKLEVPLNTSTEKIVWVMSNKTEFFNNVSSKLNMTSVILPNGLKVYYSDIKGREIKKLIIFNLIRFFKLNDS